MVGAFASVTAFGAAVMFAIYPRFRHLELNSETASRSTSVNHLGSAMVVIDAKEEAFCGN